MLKLSLVFGTERFEGDVLSSEFSRENARLEGEFALSIPIVPIGGTLATSLRAPHTNRSLEVEGRIVHQSRGDDHVRCGLAYPASDVPAIRNLLYQRRAVRVSPSQTLPVHVRIQEKVALQVHDLSTGGISFLVPSDDQQLLLRWTLKFRIGLPGVKGDLSFEGHVRARRLAGAAILYCIEFDEQRTRDLAKKQEQIHEYVMMRQAELLQERARRLTG